jgi:hypothetical protein
MRRRRSARSRARGRAEPARPARAGMGYRGPPCANARFAAGVARDDRDLPARRKHGARRPRLALRQLAHRALRDETLQGLKEFEAHEAAEIFAAACELDEPYWDTILELRKGSFDEFASWYRDSDLDKALQPLNERMWVFCDRTKKRIAELLGVVCEEVSEASGGLVRVCNPHFAIARRRRA